MRCLAQSAVYIRSWWQCEALHSKPGQQSKSLLPALRIRQYHFGIINACRQYFNQRVRPSDFRDGNPNFPMSSLHMIIPYIINGQEYANISFPPKWAISMPPAGLQQWQYQAPPPAQPSVPPPASFPAPVPTNTFDITTKHPVIQQEFGPYHQVYNGKIQLTNLCRRSQIVVSDLVAPANLREIAGNQQLCYIDIVGHCRNIHCKRKHCTREQLGAAFCADLCRQLKQGREYLTHSPTAGGKRAV